MVQKLNLERQAAEEAGSAEDNIHDGGSSDVSALLLPFCRSLSNEWWSQNLPDAPRSRQDAVQCSPATRAAEPRSGTV